MMNGKKYLYILIFIISAILLINIIWPSAFLSKFKKEVFHNFKDNSETYIKIKDYFIQKYEENNYEELLLDKAGYIREYINDRPQTHTQYIPKDIQEELNKVSRFSEYFDFVTIKKLKG